MTRTIGLTGGYATGKSTVSRMLAELGAVIVDADAIVHELQAPGTPLLGKIVDEFGPEVLDAAGALDREALGAVVFRDAEARKRLEKLVHPRVGEEMARRIAAAHAAGSALIVLDIPLLLEGRASGRGSAASGGVELVVLVYAPRKLSLERAMERDGLSRGEAERRLASQLDIEEKRAAADVVIDNAGSLEETERQVRALWERLTRP